MRTFSFCENLSTVHLHALGSLLGKGVLPNLQCFDLSSTRIASEDLAVLLRGIEQSACADKLQHLDLSSCSICPEGAEVLGLASGSDILPSLVHLNICRNAGLGDEGVSFLGRGLQTSSRTKLKILQLSSVGMGDAGLKSLAEALSSGALEHCSFFGADYNNPSLRNLFPFATALKSGGLRNLANFNFTQGHDSAAVPASVAILTVFTPGALSEFEEYRLT